MAVAVRRAVILMLAAASLLSGCAAGKSAGERPEPAQPERTAAERKAWEQLSSILTDLSFLNARFDQKLKLTRDIGATMSVSSQVPYADYEKMSERLRAWRSASSAEFPAYWDELASSALDMTDSLVKYAYDGDDYLLASADEAHQRLNATVDEHCDKPDYSLFIEYCK